jgi:outer membrane receptor for ferrienterochelin and colicin
MRQMHWFLATPAAVLWLLHLLAQPVPATAQPASGAIQGKVVDAQTGEPLTGAYVFLGGTQIGGVCDLEGSFVLKNVAPGTYTLSSSMIGYNKISVQKVVVQAGKTIRLDFSLQPEALSTEEVVVEAQAVRDTEATLLRERQKAPAVSDAISAQQISRSGSGDAAEAMTHVTGAAVEGGRYVVIRGLGDRYSAVQLNGATLPSADPDKRAVAMDLFPADLLENIVTVKTFTPDRPGSFTGGAVDIGTRSFPEGLTFSLSASTSYNPQVSLKEGYLSYKGGKRDWLGLDDGSRDLPKAVARSAGVPDIGAAYTDPEKARSLDQLSKAFSPVMAPSSSRAPLSHGYSLSLGHQPALFGRPLGLLGTFTYSRDHSSYEGGQTARWKLTGRVSQVEELTNNYALQDHKSTDAVLWGGLLTVAYKLHPNHELTLSSMLNQSSDNTARYLTGDFPRDLDEGATYETRVLHFAERRLRSLQGRGKHRLPGLLRLDWTLSAASSTQEEPDLRFFTNNYTVAERAAGLDTFYTIQTSIYPTPTRYFRDLEEHNREFQADLSRPVGMWNGLTGSLKAGGAGLSVERRFAEQRYEFRQDQARYEGDPEHFFASANMGLVDSTGTLYRFGNFLQDASQQASNYRGEQRIWAGYLMADLPLSRNLRLIGGARAEATRLKVRSADPALAEGRLEVEDLLPSLNLVYQLLPAMNLRGAYGRTLARPTFRELAPYASFDFVGDYTLIGNRDLDRTLVDNFDLRWEWFRQPGELYAASLFLKEFTNPIERAILTDNGEVQFQNVEQARVLGVELEARQGLAVFSPALNSLFAGANLSLVRSEVSVPANELLVRRILDPDARNKRSLQGQSPFLLNLDLSYDNLQNGLAAGLYYNLFGDRLAEVSLGGTPDVYEKAHGALGLTISAPFNHAYRVKLSASNLLNTAYAESYRYKGREFISQRYQSGRSYSLGLSYAFNR